MSGLNFDIVHTAVSYWMGALSEPVLMISRDEMNRAARKGALIWDVRSREAFERGHAEGARSLGGVEWLLADNSGGNLIPAAVIEDTLRQAGIQQGRAVVIYAEQRAVDAFVALRALRSIGICDAQVCVGDASPDVTAGPARGAAQPSATALGHPGVRHPSLEQRAHA